MACHPRRFHRSTGTRHLPKGAKMDPQNWNPDFHKWRIKLVAKPYPKWELIKLERLDSAKMGNANVLRVAVIDEHHQPKPNVYCCEDWPQLDRKLSPITRVTESFPGEKVGECEFDIGDSFIVPDKDIWGVKTIWVEKDRSKSDELQGLGLVNMEPTFFRLVFKWTDKPTPPPPPKPPLKK
jgi:hypothetical protein